MSVKLKRILGEEGVELEPSLMGGHRYLVQGPVGNPPIWTISENNRVIDYKLSKKDALSYARESALVSVQRFIEAFPENKEYRNIIDETQL
ncbi:MAG: hypothetical protein RL557_373 [archaeon]|jgi:hypothetical protein